MAKQPGDPNKVQKPVDPEYQKHLAESQQAKQALYSNFGKLVREESYDPFVQMQPYTFNPKTSTDQNKNFERYYSHSSFDKLGYNPWSDNESLYNEKGSAMGDVGRAAISAMKLAGTGFMSPLRSYADALAGDTFVPDYKSGKEMAYQNTIGSSSRKGATGFMSNLITNSGYTLGIIGEMALETAALAAVAPASGGSSAVVLGGRLGKFGKDFGKLYTAVTGIQKTASAFKEYGAAKAAWQMMKSTGKFINPLENTTEAIGKGIKAVQSGESIAALARHASTAGDFFRDIQMANLTISEAKMEGAMVEQEVERELRERHKARNGGKEPTYEEMLQIKESAADAGMKTLAWNIPTIFLTNKLTFQPLLKSFTKPSEFVLRNGVKFIEKEGEGFVEATFKNRLKAGLKPKNFAVAPLKYFKANFSEGLQESAQEVISGTAKDYYKSLYWDNRAKQGLDFGQGQYQNKGVWDALSANVADQFTGKGFEVFASGFLMGGLVSPVSASVQAAMGYRGAEYRNQRKAYTKATLTTLNEIYKDPLKYFAPNIINYANGTQAVANQVEAERTGNQKEWLDAENSNLVSSVMTSLDTGTYNVFLDKLRSIRTIDEQGIKDAYGIEGREVLSKLDKIVSRAEKVKENYEKWNERYPNPFDLSQMDKESPQYVKAAVGFAAWENAKKMAIFNETTMARNAERIANLSANILETGELFKISGNDISLIFHPTTIANELKILDRELEVLEGGEIRGDRSTIAAKRSKQKRLTKLDEALHGYYLSQVKTEKDQKLFEKRITLGQLRRAYYDYIQHLAVSQTTVIPVNDLELENSFKKFLDLHELKQENIHYSTAISILSDPKGFVDQYEKLHDVMRGLYQDRSEIIQNSIDHVTKDIESNTILNALHQRGFVVTPDNAERLIEKKELPTEFFDINAKQVVDETDPRYQDFKRIVENYVQGTAPEATVVTPVPEVVDDQSKGAPTSTPQPTQSVTTPVVSTIVVKEPLSIDIVKKFDDVKTGEALEALEAELTVLMGTTTLEERMKLGITGNAINDRIKAKQQELASELTFENLKIGNVVALVNEKDGNAVIVRKGKTTVTYRVLGDVTTTTTVKDDNVKNTFKFKYSDQMKNAPVHAIAEDVTTAKKNAQKHEDMLNNKEVLTEIMNDAYSREVEFQKEFENQLGCK